MANIVLSGGSVLAIGGGAFQIGTSGGGGAPSAPLSLQVINQGGPNNGTYTGSYSFNGFSFQKPNLASSDYQAVTWLDATPSSAPISKYNVYRNGTLYDSVATPISITGWIDNGSGSAGTVLHVTAVSGGASVNGISDGKILSGLKLTGSGITAGTAVITYTTSPTGGGGTGSYSVNFTQLVGSSGAQVTFKGWAYNDTQSTGCISVSYLAPGNTYVYTVSAVDTNSNEGPQAGANAYIYQGSTFVGSSNFDYGTVTTNYSDTTGAPVNGPFAMGISWPFPNSGGFQPVYSPGSSSTNSTMGLCPLENFNSSGFKFLVMDLKFTDNSFVSQFLQTAPIARGFGTTTGAVDVFLPGDTDLDLFSFGTPVLNQWATFKIPLSATSYGITTVMGFFVGTAQFSGNLTVTSIVSKNCALIGGNAYVSGSGMPTTSYVTGGTAGGTGVYNITGPNIIGNETIGSSGTPVQFVLNRNISYKVGTQWSGGLSAATKVFGNNFGFSAS